MTAGGGTFLGGAVRRFWSDRPARLGVALIVLLVVPAIAAPLLANGRPLVAWGGEAGMRFPFLSAFFAPDSTEFLVEQIFNYLLIFLPVWAVAHFLIRRRAARRVLLGVFAALLLIPFLLADRRLDKTDYRRQGQANRFSRPAGPTGSAPTRRGATWPRG